MSMFVFPGQGSQQVGMGKFLFDNFKSASLIYEEGSEALSLDLKKLCFNSHETDLALTENTQPALLVTSTATAAVLAQEFEVKPELAAGHSIGEYAALVTAGSLALGAALRSVRTRGQAMQAAVPVGLGGMAAVLGLEPKQVQELCDFVVKQSGQGPLSPANFNAPGQVVISGSAKSLAWLSAEFKPVNLWGADGPSRVKVIPLQVSAPFHCTMMKPAEDKMREVLTQIEFNDAKFPIAQNFTAQPETKAAVLRENLIRQVSAPVRWTESMQNVSGSGFNPKRVIVECGHGKVLAGLIKKILPEFTVFGTNSLDDLKQIKSQLKGAV